MSLCDTCKIQDICKYKGECIEKEKKIATENYISFIFEETLICKKRIPIEE